MTIVVIARVMGVVASAQANEPATRNQFYAPVVEQFYKHRHYSKTGRRIGSGLR
jgi:hypothetical protein